MSYEQLFTTPPVMPIAELHEAGEYGRSPLEGYLWRASG